MNDIVAQKDFQERMTDRIRESIGELLTDEELKKLVDKGVEKVFFEKGKAPHRSWANSHYETPSWMENTLSELLEKTMKEAVKEKVAGMDEEIKAMVEKTISEGLGVAMVNAVTSIFTQDLEIFKSNIESRLSNLTNSY